MKNCKIEGVQLYEAKDTLPEKFTREGIARFTVGEKYKVLGACHVAESTRRGGEKINAWDGILVENVATGKQFPVSINVLQGIGFIKDGENWKVVTTKTQAFTDAKEVANYKKFLKVTDVEKLTVQKFESEDTVERTYYLFERLEKVN